MGRTRYRQAGPRRSVLVAVRKAMCNVVLGLVSTCIVLLQVTAGGGAQSYLRYVLGLPSTCVILSQVTAGGPEQTPSGK